MANIKMCPICKGRPSIKRGTFGFKWTHWCERDGEKVYIKMVEPLNSWGAAVKNWNEYIKKVSE
jgi:hypothetical protein